MAEQSGPTLGDSGGGGDEMQVFRGESGGVEVHGDRGDAQPLENRADSAYAELEDLRRRAEALGIDHAMTPLYELRRQVQAAEAERAAGG